MVVLVLVFNDFHPVTSPRWCLLFSFWHTCFSFPAEKSQLVLTSFYFNHWVVVSNIFYFHSYLGKWSNLTNIFQMGWNHQLDHLFGCLFVDDFFVPDSSDESEHASWWAYGWAVRMTIFYLLNGRVEHALGVSKCCKMYGNFQLFLAHSSRLKKWPSGQESSEHHFSGAGC